MSYATGMNQAIDQVEALREILSAVADDLWIDQNEVREVPDGQLVQTLVMALKALDKTVKEIEAAGHCVPM